MKSRDIYHDKSVANPPERADFGYARETNKNPGKVKVPNCWDAKIPSKKITEYLLCLDHPEGGPKARFFMNWGFSLHEWNLLAASLIKQVNQYDFERFVEGKHGVKYIVSAPIDSPKGMTPSVKTIWMIAEGTDYPRLISAYPA